MLSCMNCMKPVTQETAKFFAEALVCADCHRVAERIEQQAMLELKQLQITLRELLRTAIITRQLTFKVTPERDEIGYVKQPTAVQVVAEMFRSQKCPPTVTANDSSKSTQLPALTQGAGGLPSSTSTQAAPSELETPSTVTPQTENSESAESARDEP